MPKQVLKIDRFHGGINNNSDARDIADEEVHEIVDGMVDSVGKVKLMPVAIDHDADSPSATAVSITPGYGLFAFSHDRGSMQQGNSEFLTNGSDFTTGSKWSETGDFALSSSKATYTHSTGVGRLWQDYDNRALTKSGTHDYKLKYTITNSSDTKIDKFELLGENGGTEMVSDSADRGLSGSVNWAQYDPNSSSFTYSESGGQLTITGTTDNVKQGAEIGTSDLETIVAGRTYTIRFKAWTVTGATSLSMNVDFGGVTSSTLGLIQADNKAAALEYEVNIKATSDAAFRIYYTSATAITWYIDDVSVYEAQFASQSVPLPNYNGTHEVILKGNQYNNVKPLVFNVKSSAGGSELITSASDRAFASGTVNWVEYSPNSTLATYTEDTSTDERIEIVGTTTLLSTDKTPAKEGAELAQANIGTLYAGQTYKISAKIYTASGTMSNFYIEMGGERCHHFDISTSTTAITKYIRIKNTTGALRIYCKNTSTTGWFIDDVSVTQPGGTFEISDISLMLHNNKHSSGTSSDHYLALSDSDETGTIQIFSKADNLWGTPIEGLTSNSSGNTRKDVFFFADGILRVCDAEFANSNPRIWYGYLDRVWFPNTGNPLYLNEWYSSTANLITPESIWHVNDFSTISSSYESGANLTDNYNVDNADNSPDYNNIVQYFPRVQACDSNTSSGNQNMINASASTALYDYFNGDGVTGGRNVVRVVVEVAAYTNLLYTGQEIYWTFRCGPWTDPTQGGDGFLENHLKVERRMSTYSAYQQIQRIEEHIEFSFHPWEMIADNDWGSGNYDALKFEAVAYLGTFDNEDLPPGADSYGYHNAFGSAQGLFMDKWENTGFDPPYNPRAYNARVSIFRAFEGGSNYMVDIEDNIGYGSWDSNGLVTLWEWDQTTGGAGWQNADGTQEYDLAVSFMYDENNESLLTDSRSTSIPPESPHPLIELGHHSLVVPSDATITGRPHCFIALKNPNASQWNKRMTGFKMYLRKREVVEQPYYLFCTVDFLTGKAFIQSSQTYINAMNMSEIGETYIGFNIPPEYLISPPTDTTYEMETGRELDEKSIDVKYKAITMAGKRLYVGNLEIDNGDGSKDYRADGMLKSEPFAYDAFPSNNIIDVSTDDGDEIIALENYADRILQYKRRKLHIINISQDSEFLEATYDFKGVEYPAAVCRTDVGIAWLNEEGVYLYDGKNITNLLEKKGLRLISQSYYSSFIGTKPTIGYIPNKRQLIVKTGTSGTSAEDNVMIFDMTTYSWVKGVNKFPSTDPSTGQTNFVNDELGNLVLAYSDGDIQKWGTDAAASVGGFELTTKDYDFGAPAIRKKIYKVYITYKATGAVDASTNITCKYRVNGVDSVDKTFKNGTGFTSNDLLCTDAKWSQAELKPSTSSEANNIYSFQLHLDADGTTPADFEINDITIIYRVKSIK